MKRWWVRHFENEKYKYQISGRKCQCWQTLVETNFATSIIFNKTALPLYTLFLSGPVDSLYHWVEFIVTLWLQQSVPLFLGMTLEELGVRWVELGTIMEMACRYVHKPFFLEKLISLTVWKTVDLLIFLGGDWKRR